MVKNKDEIVLRSTPIQLELFGSTRRLNLSKTYVNIPKEVDPNDPSVVWKTDYIALPIEKSFSIQGNSGEKTHICQIKPALILDPKTNEYKSKFPHFRELKIENALICLISKFWQSISYHGEGATGPVLRIELSVYQIQKEIIDAINTENNTNKRVKDCPFNFTDVMEGLTVLKETSNSVMDAETRKISYKFNRIKDMYVNENTGRVIIEIGSIISEYIKNGEWDVVDSTSILAASNYYDLKVKTHLHMNFKFVKEGAYYHASFARLVEQYDFVEYDTVSQTIFKLKQLLLRQHEVDRVEVFSIKEGRKIVDAVFHIYGSESFTKTMIKSNKLRKRTRNALIEQEEEIVLLEPLEDDFSSTAEYHREKKKYDIAKGKILHARLHSK